jgi:hypothetical protein
MKTTLYRALYVSRHFEFEAYGETEHKASVAMHNTLTAHALQYGIAGDWYAADDISIYPIELDSGLRDREPIKTPSRV